MTGIIIQARMGSQRFPGKMMALLNSIPIIEWVMRRSMKARLTDTVILATSINRENDVLERKARELGVSVFRGSEDDVLERFAMAARAYGLQTVVRVCADNPLICPDELDNLITYFMENRPDYAFNVVSKFDNLYPDGLGGEIVSNGTLQALHEKVTLQEEREHIFNYIWNHSETYSIGTFKATPAIAYPDIKLDVNTEDDLKYLDSIPFDIGDGAEKIIRKVIHGRTV
jgi:spore coat polysaccharide biosynthesis protein SpsF